MNYHDWLWSQCCGVSSQHRGVAHLRQSHSAVLDLSRCLLTDLLGTVCTTLQIYSKVRPPKYAAMKLLGASLHFFFCTVATKL